MGYGWIHDSWVLGLGVDSYMLVGALCLMWPLTWNKSDVLKQFGGQKFLKTM